MGDALGEPHTHAMATYSDTVHVTRRNIFCVPAFSFTFVENYVHLKNVSSGGNYINKGVRYWAEWHTRQGIP